MTKRESAKYFYEWGLVRKIFRAQGVAPKECDAKRHELHVEALGTMKSSSDFTSADLDKVLVVFRRISNLHPAGDGPTIKAIVEAERRPTFSARQRKLFVLDKLLKQLGRDRNYAAGIARNMSLSTADFETLPDDEFKKVLAALNKQVARVAKQVAGATPTDPDWAV